MRGFSTFYIPLGFLISVFLFLLARFGLGFWLTKGTAMTVEVPYLVVVSLAVLIGVFLLGFVVLEWLRIKFLEWSGGDTAKMHPSIVERAFWKERSIVLFLVCVALCFSIPEAFAHQYDSTGAAECLSGQSIDFTYFSYTTLSTLGYGDIQPLGDCRLLAIVEATLGTLVLPILVAQCLYTLSICFPVSE